jgi:hypothetical protein
MRKFAPVRLLESIALLSLLGLVAGREVIDCNAVLDFDIWWHLRTGKWIVESHAVPRTGLFSRTMSDTPWLAYSWGFEVLIERVEHWFGLVGLTLFCALLVLMVVYVLFWMLHRVSRNFWTAFVLTAIGTWAIYHNTAPRPVLFSMAFFCVVLAQVFEANRSSSVKPLYWTPLVFFLWANLHIQFVYGLFVIGLFAVVTTLQQLAKSRGLTLPYIQPRQQILPILPLFGIVTACFVATLIGPYSFRLYRVIFEYATSSASYQWITELQALSFRNSAHYAQLLITAAAFFALGRSRSGVDAFKFLLLTIITLVAYRTTRDSWFVCIPALAIVAEALASEQTEPRASLVQRLCEIVAAVVIVITLGRVYGVTDATLRAKMMQRFPVRSVEFIQKAKLPGPIYNTLNFGGYLIWNLPEYPVSIDGRNDLYGDQIDTRYWEALRGRSGATDPDIATANTLLIDRNYPLVDLIAADQRFRLVFMDPLSAVFIRR